MISKYSQKSTNRLNYRFFHNHNSITITTTITTTPLYGGTTGPVFKSVEEILMFLFLVAVDIFTLHLTDCYTAKLSGVKTSLEKELTTSYISTIILIFHKHIKTTQKLQNYKDLEQIRLQVTTCERFGKKIFCK